MVKLLRAAFHRTLIIDSIRNDPDWTGGDYTTQPKSAQLASVFYAIATNGGTLAHQKAAPTRDAADRIVDARLKAPFRADANDVLYQWDSSRDYNPAPKLERIQAALLVINSADDERNPPETGLMDRALDRVKGAKPHLIPASEATAGHGTTAQAKFYSQALRDLLASAPRRPNLHQDGRRVEDPASTVKRHETRRVGARRGASTMSNASATATVEMLQAFADAWNRHDTDALMSFMSEARSGRSPGTARPTPAERRRRPQ